MSVVADDIEKVVDIFEVSMSIINDVNRIAWKTYISSLMKIICILSIDIKICENPSWITSI